MNLSKVKKIAANDAVTFFREHPKEAAKFAGSTHVREGADSALIDAIGLDAAYRLFGAKFGREFDEACEAYNEQFNATLMGLKGGRS